MKESHPDLTRTEIGHVGYVKTLCKEAGIDPDTEWDCQFDTPLPERKFAVNLNQTYDKRCGAFWIKGYSDGSRYKEKVGAGLVLHHYDRGFHEKAISLSKENTVFQAEAEGLRQMAVELQKYISQGLKVEKAELFLDNLSVIYSLKRRRSSSKTITACFEELNKLALVADLVEVK